MDTYILCFKKKPIFYFKHRVFHVFSSFKLDEPMTQLFNGQSKELIDNDQKVIFIYLSHI